MIPKEISTQNTSKIGEHYPKKIEKLFLLNVKRKAVPSKKKVAAAGATLRLLL